MEQHRSYLGLVARLEMPAHLHAQFDPSDLVQQTFEEVCRQPERMESLTTGQQRAYLRQALKNNIRDAVGRVDVRLRVALDESSARLESLFAADQSTPEERAEREERFEQLARALEELPEDQRRAVELKHLHGLSVADIARALGKTDLAVGGLLRRGIKALRGRLGAIGRE